MQNNNEMRLDRYMTSNEVVELMKFNNLSTLTQPGYGFADRNNIEAVMIGGTRGYRVEDVIRGALNEIETASEWIEFSEKLWAWQREKATPRAVELGVDCVTVHDAMAILGIGSRERMYQLGDWRGGPVRTIEFGRVRLYSRADVEAVQHARV